MDVLYWLYASLCLNSDAYNNNIFISHILQRDIKKIKKIKEYKRVYVNVQLFKFLAIPEIGTYYDLHNIIICIMVYYCLYIKHPQISSLSFTSAVEDIFYY